MILEMTAELALLEPSVRLAVESVQRVEILKRSVEALAASILVESGELLRLLGCSAVH